MTGSRERMSCEDILKSMLAVLDERGLRRQVDDPIDMTLARFLRERIWSAPMALADVLDVAGELLEALYSEAAPLRRVLPRDKACAHALRLLLEECPDVYASHMSCIMGGAPDQAIPALRRFLAALADAVKRRERAMLVGHGLNMALNALSWEKRCCLAEHIQQRWRAVLEPALLALEPYELAPLLPSLIADYASSDNVLRSMLGE